MIRRVAVVSVMAACGPEPAGESASASSTTSTMSTSTTSGTTGVPTTSTTSTTSSSTTGEPCSWYWPAYENWRFCPTPGMTVEVSGTTPLGPVDFRYGLFGLFLCTSCPDAGNPALMLYTEPPGEDVQHPAGNSLYLAMYAHEPASIEAQIDGMSFALWNKAEVTLELSSVPSEDETSPPLDDQAPPVLGGALALVGDGWDLAGSFTVTLCTDLSWQPPCE